MSVTKAWVPQISSEIFNGSGSRDLQQDRSNILRDVWDSKFLWVLSPVKYHLRAKASHKFYLYQTIYSCRCQSRTMYLISKVYEKGYNKNFLLQGDKFPEIYFLKKNGSQTLGVNLISFKHCSYTFHKQKICNSRLTARYECLSYTHLFEVYTNYCSNFVEKFKAQFFYLKCYNQNFTVRCAIYSTSYSTDKVLFTNKKTAECEKSTLIQSENYNLYELVLTFQQSGVIMVRRNWNVWDVYPTFFGLSLS